MPELPEIRVAAQVINRGCCEGAAEFTDIVFCDTERAIHVTPGWRDPTSSASFSMRTFCMRAESRGKELCLVLISSSSGTEEEKETMMPITFRFGLKGRFSFSNNDATTALDVRKQQEGVLIQFCSPTQTLTFSDSLGYGSVHLGTGFDTVKRSPDPTQDYGGFRRNILNNLHHAAFNRPICEALLDQRFFNGIGNYLRAEILDLARERGMITDPFACARTVLRRKLHGGGSGGIFAAARKRKAGDDDAGDDVLELCRRLPLEVIALRETFRGGSDADDANEEKTAFNAWLQCYKKPTSSQFLDANGRTFWWLNPKTAAEAEAGVKRQCLSIPINFPPTSDADHTAIQAELTLRDARLQQVFDEVGALDFSTFLVSPMVAAISAVIGQQISYVAAKKIRGHLYAHMGGRDYSAEQVLAVTPEQWKGWGLLNSNRVECIGRLARLPAAAVWKADPIPWEAEVAAVGGMGPWSVVTARLQCMRSDADANLFPRNDKFLERKLRKLTGSTLVPDAWDGYLSYVTWYLWRWF